MSGGGGGGRGGGDDVPGHGPARAAPPAEVRAESKAGPATVPPPRPPAENVAEVTTQPAATPQPAEPDPAAEPKPPVIVTRMYDVTDLLRPARNFPYDSAVVPPTLLPNRRWRYGGGGASASGGLFTGQRLSPEEEARHVSEEAFNNLTKLIQENVDPLNWRDSGGSIGSIRNLGSVMVVQQTAEGRHRSRRSWPTCAAPSRKAGRWRSTLTGSSFRRRSSTR